MPQIGNKHAEYKALPDTQVVCRAKNECLVQGEEEIEIGELGQNNIRHEGDRVR